MKGLIGSAFTLIRNGASIKQGVVDGGYPITRIETISDGNINRNKYGYAGINNIKKYSDYIIRDGDILMSHINSEKHLGKTALYTKNEGEIVIHGMNLLLLRANPQIVYSRYANYYFKSSAYRNQISRITKKSVNQASFTVTALKELTIPLPPVAIQKQIADTLDKASRLIELRKTQLEKMDLLIKSKFIEMFGDPVTNPLGWKVGKLELYIRFLTSGSRGWASYFCEDGEMFLTIKNVKNSKINIDDIQYVHAPSTQEAIRTKVQENDLLISITADLGRTGVVSKEVSAFGAYINQHLSLVRLDLNTIHPLYVSYYLESEAGKHQFSSKNQVGVKSGLNFDAIKSLMIMVPPISRQNDFVAYVKEVECNAAILNQSLNELETMQKALMQEYFTNHADE